MTRSSRRRAEAAATPQLSLFDLGAGAPSPDDLRARSSPAPRAPDPMPAIYEEAAQLAARLPPGVHLGTSSWSFPGWQGIVYGARHSTEELAQIGLAEYARHPLLTTVGIDRSFYAPVPDADYVRYAAQLPPGFRCVSKALHAVVSQTLQWARVPRAEHADADADRERRARAPRDPAARAASATGGHASGGYGVQPNPDFLSVPLFLERVVAPLLAGFPGHAGPVLLELPPIGPAHRLPPRDFFTRLDSFFGALPRVLPYAVELRERAYFTGEYREILAAHGVAHAYTYWRNMPSPGAQTRVVPVGNAPFAIVRLSLKPGRRYDAEKERFAPFNAIVEPDPAMRDEVVRILCEAGALSMDSFVLVNNKAEGCAPLTVRAIAEGVAAAWNAGDRDSRPER